MSQEKVDKYKKEKYDRKNTKKKSNAKKIIGYIVALIIAVAFIVYIGYSIAVSTGKYTPPKAVETTTPAKLSDEQLESLRDSLIQKKDPNVQTESAADSKDAETTAAVETTK